LGAPGKRAPVGTHRCGQRFTNLHRIRADCSGVTERLDASVVMPVPVIGRNFATCVSADVFVAHLVLLLWGLDSMSELRESIFV
jgi:hypothetical protein